MLTLGFCSKRIEVSIKDITDKSESKKMEVSRWLSVCSVD
jgi:hypothetical protein